jgi:demethylmenaquinone methyltransferase/2-methoxy-6-polyprenyl-1,4-benzoquinol methylase
MVDAAAAKGAGRAGVAFIVGDALRLPFSDGAFDAVTVAFGLRNMTDYDAALCEFGRVIRPGGRLVCLEMTSLRRAVLGRPFGWYFGRLVPFVGGIVSGNRDAYRYLPSSVAAFPDADALAAMMGAAGFASAKFRRLGGGAVALHVARK